MTYGVSKQRDMIRSVLPSTSRTSARNDLRSIKQRNRSNIRKELRTIAKGIGSSDVIDNYDESAADLNYYPDTEILYIVDDRRGADKVQPLMRWAPSQVKDARKEDRLSKMYALLPDNTIGRHAVSHIQRVKEFEIIYPHNWWYSHETPEERNARWDWEKACAYAEAVENLHLVMERGLVSRFNKYPTMVVLKEVTKEEYEANRYRYRPENPSWMSKWSGDSNYRHVRSTRRWRQAPLVEGYYYASKVRRPLMGGHDIETFLKEADKDSIKLAFEKIGV